ncbi:MAG: hypothetical protein WC557_00675 [Ignavibacteriaceae bacterium]
MTFNLKNIFWDYDFSEEELRSLFNHEINKAAHLDRAGLYARMLVP